MKKIPACTITAGIGDPEQVIDEFLSDEMEPNSSQDVDNNQYTELSCSKISTQKPSQVKEGSLAWRGIPLQMLCKSMDVYGESDGIRYTACHQVLFKLPFFYDGRKPPDTNLTCKDKWDSHHVKMPCSNFSEYPASDKSGQPIIRRRWEMIEEALVGNISSSTELEKRILSYNSRYYGKWNFTVLHTFFKVIEEDERKQFFDNLISKMAHLALQLPLLCKMSIPLLKENKNFSITLSQQQIACLLANAFFCTYPLRNSKSKNTEYYNYPNINFNTLFMGPPSEVKFEKLKCIIHYFKRIFQEMPCGTVTFQRQHLQKTVDWNKDSTELCGLHVSSEGTIEDDGCGMLQVDFANRLVGGGVLGHGCVQEEIRFLICPEMIVSRLFTACLQKNECLIMTGCERFSDYDGYSVKFVWKGNYQDRTPRDAWGRIKCEVVAIDALELHDYKSQFSTGMVHRELIKAYCGFVNFKHSPLPAVCTGNWGCGAFGGDKQLKALIQLMAAAKAKRDLCYFTFNDEKLRDDIYEIHQYLTTDNRLGIGHLLKLCNKYRKEVLFKMEKGKPKCKLFEFILKEFDHSKETDEDKITDENKVITDKDKVIDVDSNQSNEIKHIENEGGACGVSCDTNTQSLE